MGLLREVGTYEWESQCDGTSSEDQGFTWQVCQLVEQ